jgi:hypothetical protein
LSISLFLALMMAACWLATLFVAPAPGIARAQQQQPSQRPPLSATDQYLTSIAPPPTQPGQSGGGGQPAPTHTPLPASPTASPAPPRATRTASPVPPTETPVVIEPTSTPVVIMQTVVQTVVQTVMQTVVVSSTPQAVPTSVPAPVVQEAPAAPVPAEPGPWVWIVAVIPLLALVLAVMWVIRRDPIVPGWYPNHGRPRRAGLLPGRRSRRASVRLPE